MAISEELATANILKERYARLQQVADDTLEALQQAQIEGRGTQRLSEKHIVDQGRANAAHRAYKEVLSRIN